jgi:hypothetical protein
MGFILLGAALGLNEIAKRRYPRHEVPSISQETRMHTQDILSRRQYLRGYRDAMRELNPPSRRER